MNKTEYERLLLQALIDWQSIGTGAEILSIKEIDWFLDAVFMRKGIAYYDNAQGDFEQYLRLYNPVFRKIVVGVYNEVVK